MNGNKQELMIIKELFEGPVGDYCIARNTIKCLLYIILYNFIQHYTLYTIVYTAYAVYWFYIKSSFFTSNVLKYLQHSLNRIFINLPTRAIDDCFMSGQTHYKTRIWLASDKTKHCRDKVKRVSNVVQTEQVLTTEDLRCCFAPWTRVTCQGEHI